MKKRLRKLKLRRETVLHFEQGRVAGGEFTFACSDNPCDTGFRDCTIDYQDTNGPECTVTATSVYITCPNTGQPTVCNC